ncbi:hypothetical protein GPX89_33215 [Nocardia sp. ET3-3]|uniref:Exosortase/archaeosortase family protein n=1 Tax=Nocardia terrae TaxID=2675851 RepID=A0A7K1V673_9NOCA|nr:hypothetical protein [Nocardia terrae]MVU82086.1 hypothetical protein [Nocardia terrae]
MSITASLEAQQRAGRVWRGPQWRTMVGLVFVLLCTLVAFGYTWLELLGDMRHDSDIGYVFVLAVVATFAAVGVALRYRGELPIYDRQTDIIVGLLGLGLTGALLSLLVLRYPYQYEVLHLDLVAAPLFLMSVSVLVFGLRPVFRFWPAWLLVLLTAAPTPYRQMVTVFGGSKVAEGVAALVLGAMAAAIGSGRTWRRALMAAVLTLVLGAVALAVLWRWFPDMSLFAYQAVPTIPAVCATTAIMYLYHRNWSTVKPLDRPVRPLTAARSRAAITTAVVATALIAPIPLPHDYVVDYPDLAGLVISEAPGVPPGWEEFSRREYPWAPRFFGPGTSWTRSSLVAQRGNPDWDKESRRRRIVVDVERSPNPNELERHPQFVLYRLIQPRISAPVRIDLGHGITGRLNTVVDDRRLLSWTWLSWRWRGHGGAELVSLISADNHLPDAEFPQPEPSVLRNADNLLHQILRGNAVTLDPESEKDDTESEYKDQDMLTSLARSMVAMGGDE